MISLLIKTVPGSVVSNEGGGHSYPGAGSVSRDTGFNDGAEWETWLMLADDGFQAQPGDTILAGWDPFTGRVSPSYPIQSDLFDYVQPIGNVFNPDLSTYDGTLAFPVHHRYSGHVDRFWGTVNAYPDGNQSRRIMAYRFETDFAGQLYQRVRFILGEPFDKDHTPNALAILIYTDPERQNYFYTPGAFILDETDPENTIWYADTTIGQSPVGTPEPVHYAVALGSSPLNGGGTIPADWPDVLTHHSFNWENNLSFSASTQDSIQAFKTRMGWLGYTVLQQANEFSVGHPDFPGNKVFNILTDQIFEDVPTVKPAWMSEPEYWAMEQAFEKAAGREVISIALSF